MNITKNGKAKVSSGTVIDEVLDSGKYDEAILGIQSAIDTLCTVAAEDEKAKEAIANLSVVILDLRS